MYKYIPYNGIEIKTHSNQFESQIIHETLWLPPAVSGNVKILIDSYVCTP